MNLPQKIAAGLIAIAVIAALLSYDGPHYILVGLSGITGAAIYVFLERNR